MPVVQDKSRNRNGFEESMAIVRTMLERVLNGESIEDIRNVFIENLEYQYIGTH